MGDRVKAKPPRSPGKHAWDKSDAGAWPVGRSVLQEDLLRPGNIQRKHQNQPGPEKALLQGKRNQLAVSSRKKIERGLISIFKYAKG